MRKLGRRCSVRPTPGDASPSTNPRRRSASSERLRAENLADLKAGKFKDAAESVDALYAATAHLGTEIPGALIAEAVEKHGHLGLAALDVAADWTIARTPTAAPRRISPSRRQPRSRRRRSPRRARAPDGDPDLPLAGNRSRLSAETFVRGSKGDDRDCAVRPHSGRVACASVLGELALGRR